MSVFVNDIRIGIGESDKKRDKGLKTPNDIKRFDNINYGNDEMQVLDVYRPLNVNSKLPVIVNVHGGGWVYGSKECYQYYCMSLAQYGFAVVNFSYRLAPEYKFPASLEDTCKVFDWILENSEYYGFDIENIFAIGDSAGGHILSLYSCMCSDVDMCEYFGFKPNSYFAPKAIALNCGVYSPFLDNEDDTLTKKLLKEVMIDSTSEKEIYYMNVLNHINKNFPPSFIMTCNGDFLKKQAIALAQGLTENNSEFLFKFYSPDSVELSHVFNCDIRNIYAQDCMKEECSFFINHINK